MLPMVVVGAVASVFILIVSSSAVSDWVLARIPDYAPVLQRLPRYEGQSGDPELGREGARIDIAAVRRAAEAMPDDARYYVQSPEPFKEDVDRLARLYFLPALAVRHASAAEWILAFRSRAPPRGLVLLAAIPVSRDFSLFRVAPR